jgi:hypothetical protein
MTRWRYDADPRNPYEEERIPVIPECPAFGYLLGIDKHSVHQPTAAELIILASLGEFYRTRMFTAAEQRNFALEPFDIHPGNNTPILRKYGFNDWGYRRATWPVGRVTPPSPRVPTRMLGPWTVTHLVDVINGVRTDSELGKAWERWKVDHPAIFRGALA